ncbi:MULTISPECIES: RbsD/FucU family protein [unclassified Sporosarcina]|uniref:RbsD/FucU family protein n=1 Tax=unclassified Sporosarcina TaxID=2647733 RepID=UPI00203C6B30|nr:MULTISPECIES: RbsD/FucU domain-containing protein [unclassified Sporosarcina]GKV65936.1 fucose isomerase [Sporosarcina sp. NCCP-2331]GLB56064.1 fucose isomerase [Sporosarcina sp. NCCP-2378]
MLKNIPNNLSPDILKILMEMGHGDEILIADGNFPSVSHTTNILRLDGQSVPEVLRSILFLLPLDDYEESGVKLMEPKENEGIPVIWNEYAEILKQTNNDHISLTKFERFDFYKQAKKAYAIIATGEQALYANIILRKGVIKRGDELVCWQE